MRQGEGEGGGGTHRPELVSKRQVQVRLLVCTGVRRFKGMERGNGDEMRWPTRSETVAQVQRTAASKSVMVTFRETVRGRGDRRQSQSTKQQ